jgi:hypothetical protein
MFLPQPSRSQSSKAKHFVLALFILSSFSRIDGQTLRLPKQSLIKFDYNCASTDVFKSAKLDQVVPRILKHYPNPDANVNRAFAFDLNGDDQFEYFVPFGCGATGNCDWGVFSQNKFLGMVNGQYIYVYQRRNIGWPHIYGYGHLSAVEGTLETYRFRRHYERHKPGYAIGEPGAMLEIQKVKGHELPRLFEIARAACTLN